MCLTPYQVKHNGDNVGVPCGKCETCIKRRISAWSFRLMQQDKDAETSYFITLTYDNVNLPISSKGLLTLERGNDLPVDNTAGVKRGLTAFFKRLRRSHQEHSYAPIKYYCVGEYGSRFGRPHYHGIMFNLNLELMLDKGDLVALDLTGFDGKHQVKIKQWPFGLATIGRVSGASIGYTLKYMCKPRKAGKAPDDDRVPEFAVMSKGLGLNYLTDQAIAWHKADILNRMYCVVEDGKKLSMPRYYKDRIYDEFERQMVGAEQRRKLLIKQEGEAALFSSRYDYEQFIHRGIVQSYENMWTKSLQTRMYE